MFFFFHLNFSSARHTARQASHSHRPIIHEKLFNTLISCRICLTTLSHRTRLITSLKWDTVETEIVLYNRVEINNMWFWRLNWKGGNYFAVPRLMCRAHFAQHFKPIPMRYSIASCWVIKMLKVIMQNGASWNAIKLMHSQWLYCCSRHQLLIEDDSIPTENANKRKAKFYLWMFLLIHIESIFTWIFPHKTYFHPQLHDLCLSSTQRPSHFPATVYLFLYIYIYAIMHILWIIINISFTLP